MAMDVQIGPRDLTFPSEQLAELRDANELLGDPAALHQRIEEDGYLLLRRLIDPDKVLAARQAILQFMHEREVLAPGTPVLEGVMRVNKTVGMMGREGVAHQPAVLAALEAKKLFDFYGDYFGEPARTFDYKWLRAVGHEHYTHAHYDVVYMGQGSTRLHTCWIPLGDIPVDHGTLAICVGSHKLPGFERVRQTYGKMDVDRDGLDDGSFHPDPMAVAERFGGQWATTHFHPGDVITFGMFTMHASTTNLTGRFRLSCDVRYQPAAEPADKRWVGDHPIGHYSYSQKDQPKASMAAALVQAGLREG